ncbi:MAG: TlpA family protein disulfide reductase [Bacteroidales bacterium]|nr:TlpA family protein disulfide reductase [Bacteroidales bacterium]
MKNKNNGQKLLKVFYFLISLIAITACTSKPETKTIELPPASFANSRTLEMAKVTLTDSVTVLDVAAFYTPEYWIKIASDSYLLADGEKYMIRSGEGIDLDSLFWMPKSGEASFKLLFEPLPINTKQFDFIESDCEDCFKIYGINLANKQMPQPKLPRKFKKEHKEETDLQLGWEKGDAIVSGKIWGYVPNTVEWTVMYSNPITGKNNNIPLEIDNKGAFNMKIPIYSPTNLLLASKIERIPIKVAPGKESSIIINLPELYRLNSRLLKEQEHYGKKYYYAGYLARLNNDLANEDIIEAVQWDYNESVADMDVNEYKAFLIDKYHESVAHNDALDISPLAKKVTKAIDAFALSDNIEFADSHLIEAFAEKHQLSREEAQKRYKSVERAEDYQDYYQLTPYNDPEMLFVPYIAFHSHNLGYARKHSNDPYEVVRYLSQHDEVSKEDRAFFKEYISAEDNNKEFKKATSIGSVFNKYSSLAKEYEKNKMGVGFLSQIWDTEDALLFDLINAQKTGRQIEDFNPLTDEQKQDLSDYHEVVKQVLIEENEALLARIEENKNKTGFTVHETPISANEELFSEMLQPFRGKVILVDIWATWCGPCIMANKEMEPLKAQLADEEDLVFLYLAGEDSPENTWKNMIVDLKGEHYRVNQAQWDYLRESLNARGVPTYIIIDREGNHTFHTVGFPGVDNMRSELTKALNK